MGDVLADTIALIGLIASLAAQGGTNPLTILSMVTKILSLLDTLVHPTCTDTSGMDPLLAKLMDK